MNYVTDDDIRALRSEAAEAGDYEQVTICDCALGEEPGNREQARSICERVIREAWDALHDEEEW